MSIISCSSKKLQYILASISSILFAKHTFDISSADNVLPNGDNTGLIIILYIFIFPGLVWCTLLWNKWLYENTFSDSLSYENFQCIATAVLFLLSIYFVIKAF